MTEREINARTELNILTSKLELNQIESLIKIIKTNFIQLEEK